MLDQTHEQKKEMEENAEVGKYTTWVGCAKSVVDAHAARDMVLQQIMR